MKRIFIISSICAILCNYTSIVAQTVSYTNHELHMQYYNMRVKSMEEFMDRFNGVKVTPGIEASDSMFRQKNIVSLIADNYVQKMDDITKARVENFITKAVYSGTFLDFKNSIWYADVSCGGTYQGKKISLHIILKPEKIKDEVYRWSIVDVDGLQKAGLIDTTQWRTISPVEHEVSFIEMLQFLENEPQNALGMRSKSKEVDQLSYFWGLLHEKHLKLNQCESIGFYIFDVPGYVFHVSEDNTIQSHSGMLIDSVEKISEQFDPITEIKNRI